MTQYWHTYIEGYRACILNIPKTSNWYVPVRPNTKDSILWNEGWDKANEDKRVIEL